MFHRVGASARRLAFAAFDEVLTNGGHHPLLAHLQEGTNPAGRWVVKPMYSVSAANRRPGLSLIAEALGAEICARLGLEAIDWEALRGAFEALTEATARSWLTALLPELAEASRNNGHPMLPRVETFLRHRLTTMPTLLTALRELVETTP